MDIGVWIVIGLMAAFVVLLVVGSHYLERRYYRTHPPDDGIREERFDDEQNQSC